jgi:hypothetical protein
MNREEIEWITQNLFVGNKLWTGEVRSKAGKAFDLREIRSPIILFASLGDNITPPQQAFNWVADVYGSTEEIKSRGQVIVGLMHGDVGHLGIFVSGKIAKREHRQIVSVMKSIEALPPGLYAMRIIEHRGQGGEIDYDVEFEERRLEEVTERLNRFKRADEAPFEAVEAVSDFNQRAYELYARPLVQATANDFTAKLGREFHPLRFEKWSVSDRNPLLWWLGPLAQMVKAQRLAVGPDQRLRKAEAAYGEVVSATLDYYRDLRDATSEALFFQTYGNLFAMYVADRVDREGEAPVDPRELPFVKAALAAIGEGGYPEALARAGELLARRGKPVPLARLELKAELVREYADLLPDLPVHEWKRIRGEQDAIVRFEPERAVETLPRLLADPGDRERFLQVLERLTTDPRVRVEQATPEQIAMVARIRQGLGAGTPRIAAASGSR